jgi:hypothetical protein
LQLAKGFGWEPQAERTKPGALPPNLDFIKRLATDRGSSPIGKSNVSTNNLPTVHINAAIYLDSVGGELIVAIDKPNPAWPFDFIVLPPLSFNSTSA